LVGLEDAVDYDPVAGKDPSRQVVFQFNIEGLGLLSAPQVLGRLLDPDLLGVHELGLGQQQFEGAAPVAGLVHALEVLVLEFIAGLLFKEGEAAPLALEGGGDYLGADLGSRSDQAVYGQELADVIAAQLSCFKMAGQFNDPHMSPLQVDIHGQVQLQESCMGRLQHRLGAL